MCYFIPLVAYCGTTNTLKFNKNVIEASFNLNKLVKKKSSKQETYLLFQKYQSEVQEKSESHKFFFVKFLKLTHLGLFF